MDQSRVWQVGLERSGTAVGVRRGADDGSFAAPAGRVSATHGAWIFLQVTHSKKFTHCCESPHFFPFSSLLWTSPFYSTSSSDFSSCTGKMSNLPESTGSFLYDDIRTEFAGTVFEDL